MSTLGGGGEALLDSILSHLDLEVEPFALCDVRRGWRLRLRPPADVVLHFVFSGRGALRAQGADARPIMSDVLVVVPPGVEHWIECDADGRHVIVADSREIAYGSGVHRIQVGDGDPGLMVACGRVIVTYGGAAGLFDHLRVPLFQDFSDSPAVRAVFTRLFEEQSGGMPGGERMTAALMNECLIHLLRRICGGPDCAVPWLAALRDERLGRVLDAILERPAQPHSVQSLAVVAGMSRSSFNERFANAFGRSAMDFLREARLRRAAKLLRSTDLPVKAVAANVGFSSRSHFSQSFTRQFGSSPADYRAVASGL